MSDNRLPFLTVSAAAGFPSPADDFLQDSLNLHTYLVDKPASTFFIRVRGDSMRGAGIMSGDILVVDRSRSFRNGTIVVAAVSGQLCVKRVSQVMEQWSLLSENDGYAPIVLRENEELFIWGIVVGVVRKC